MNNVTLKRMLTKMKMCGCWKNATNMATDICTFGVNNFIKMYTSTNKYSLNHVCISLS